MFLSRNKQQPWEYRKVPRNLRYIGRTNALMQRENHKHVRSVNSVYCETVTTYQLWLELWEKRWNCERSVGTVRAVLAPWEQCWDCESSVTPAAVAVQASSSKGVSRLTSMAGRASARETLRCLGKPPRLENRSRAGVCPGLKWLKVITICSSELRGWYQSSFRSPHCKKNLQKWSCLEMGLAEGSHGLEVLKELLLAHADKIWSSLTCHPFMMHQEAILPFYCQSGTFHWPTAAIKISIWLVSLRNILALPL